HLSKLLDQEKIPHQVLNAKQHEREAMIIAQAGRPGAVTIATNMAGRGTDIVLGGNLAMELAAVGDDPEKRRQVQADWEQRRAQVVAAGGLKVIGTERHESRRIDNQLRGRSGRQGDPGASRFYLSLEDNLLRIFGSDRVSGLMGRLGMQEGEAIEHPWVTRAIENAQRKVEGRNFDIRKQLLEYDDVANEQRKVIYEERNRLIDVEDISESVRAIRREVVQALVEQHMPPESLEEQWDVRALEEALERELGLKLPIAQWVEQEEGTDGATVTERALAVLERRHEEKAALIGPDAMRRLEKAVMLQVLDPQRQEHLAAMDFLRQGIHLRGSAQKNPKQEYKREAFELFSDMLARVKQQAIALLARLEVQPAAPPPELAPRPRAPREMQFLHPAAAPGGAAEAAADEAEVAVEQRPVVRRQPKIGRNQPCPCGSGKKYKHCHGRLE